MELPALDRERLFKLLAMATFIIFFQGYMVAPIIPQLWRGFGARSKQPASWFLPI
ncbi:MAG: hypothetical protein ABIP64_14010 [Burkholderiales bacterium]